MLGMSCATLVVAAIELFTERGFDMLRVYQVLFPLITGVFLLPTFFGIEWLGAVSVFTMFGFEVVNLLLLITCAAYASRKAIDSSLVYALCVAPTLASLLLGDSVGSRLPLRIRCSISRSWLTCCSCACMCLRRRSFGVAWSQ